jgi:hypothetical protein
MKRLKLVGVLLGALFALGMMATSALAALSLPDISVTLTGGVYPVHAQGSSAVGAKTALETTGGGVLNGTGVTLLLLTTELSGLGTFTSDFTKVENPEAIKCHSAGDAAGVVLLGGEFHLVPISLSPLNIGILFLVTEFEVECPAGINVLVRGNVLGSVTGIGSEGTELTGFGGVLEGEKGKQKISEYYNDGGTKIKTKLESEAGAGFTASSQQVENEVKLQVLGSQMIVITGR